MKVLVIGGGFFGMYIANYFAERGHDVTLCEAESDFMKRASYCNQARVHNGYHYPRSILTAIRSKTSFPRFVGEFKDCIDGSFEKYYMISRILSKVSADQFLNFCKKIDVPCDYAPRQIKELANPDYVEEVFSVREVAFNADKLRCIMKERIANSHVKCLLNTSVCSVKKINNGNIIAKLSSSQEICTDLVYNCTYSMINLILQNSKIAPIPLKHELAEIAMVKVPKKFKKIGITVMDGPFFSLMPFPAKGVHSLSHVRYTPHFEWHEPRTKMRADIKKNRETTYPMMIRDALRYIPKLSECCYVGSIWEIKTVLPSSEASDSRPILFRKNYGMDGLHQVLGGKIDNIYDIIEAIGNEEQI